VRHGSTAVPHCLRLPVFSSLGVPFRDMDIERETDPLSGPDAGFMRLANRLICGPELGINLQSVDMR